MSSDTQLEQNVSTVETDSSNVDNQESENDKTFEDYLEMVKTLVDPQTSSFRPTVNTTVVVESVSSFFKDIPDFDINKVTKVNNNIVDANLLNGILSLSKVTGFNYDLKSISEAFKKMEDKDLSLKDCTSIMIDSFKSQFSDDLLRKARDHIDTIFSSISVNDSKDLVEDTKSLQPQPELQPQPQLQPESQLILESEVPHQSIRFNQ